MPVFAAVGDVHGHMSEMIRLLHVAEASHRVQLDFVLQVGDFEPHRNEGDLRTMAAPSKYRQLGEFPTIADGTTTLPWPVYFIGGNHEPYGYLDQQPGGFQLASNCHYLGRAFAGDLGSFQVCALSGIYGSDHFSRVRPPVTAIDRVSNKKYIYFQESEVEKLLAQDKADILVVHEWPTDVISPDDEEHFERQRRSLRYDAIGNEYARLLLEHLRPSLLLCGHMHSAYRRRFSWQDGTETLIIALSHVQAGKESVAVFTGELGDAVREL